MTKRGCLNCHFFCAYGIDINSRAPFEESVGPEFRTRESLDEKLKALSRALESPWSIKCSRGKWDSERIGNRNINEIRNAILGPDRDTCDCFAEYDQYADQNAPQESEEKKHEARERRENRILSIIAIVIALGSLVIAILAYLKT
jgi:hypothetical protein